MSLVSFMLVYEAFHIQKRERGSAVVTKNTAEETSERKRISIPKADESVLEWWTTQHDPGLSIRLLIRNEIERSGYSDVAYRPVAQLPRRGRPPVSEGVEDEPQEAGTPTAAPAPAAPISIERAPQPTGGPAPQPAPGGADLLDSIING